jgi:hypothetical protein
MAKSGQRSSQSLQQMHFCGCTERQHIFGTKFNAYTAAFAPIGVNMVFFQFRLGHSEPRSSSISNRFAQHVTWINQASSGLAVLAKSD